MFCKHEWEVITERREKSNMAQLLLSGGEVERCATRLMEDTYILVCQCKKCGKLDKTITRI